MWICFVLVLVVCQPVYALPVLNKGGERIDISTHLVQGKKNLVFFHAPWSKTSNRYLVDLDRLAKTTSQTAFHQVDVKSLESKAAKQFKIESVPYFLIFDGEGQLISRGQQAQNEVVKWLSEL